MDMDAQVWHKMPRPGQPDVYIGYWKDAKPGPEDLLRKAQLGGYYLTMRDGNKWIAPTIQVFDKASERLVCGLPTTVTLNDKGEFTPGQVDGQYSYLYEVLDKYVSAMETGEIEKQFAALTLAEVGRDAKVLLQVNYVVDSPEIVELGLWSQANDESPEASNIILTAIDYLNFARWREASKKKEPSLAAVGG